MSTTEVEMLSSPEDSDDMEATTPVNQIANPTAALTSPPDSQHRGRSMPTSASGASIANSNGKRPLQTISNGHDDMDEPTTITSSKTRTGADVKTHANSGYVYSKAEDEPGYAWLNKKAQDEFGRSWDNLQHKDLMIKNRYGDPFEMVQKERAIRDSLEQK